VDHNGAIKLLEHAVKVIERVFERRTREEVKIDAMQFGLMPGKGYTDAIFTVRYGRCKRNIGVNWKEVLLCFCRFGGKKTFDRVPREVTR